jgi:nucleoside-diphosphate-sugar epimerase
VILLVGGMGFIGMNTALRLVEAGKGRGQSARGTHKENSTSLGAGPSRGGRVRYDIHGEGKHAS